MMVAEGMGKVGAFICRYHAWAYGLDGRLKHVPGDQGFPELDRDAHDLIPVQAKERGGLVFVTQKAPLSEGAMAAVPDLLSPDQELFDYVQMHDLRIEAGGEIGNGGLSHQGPALKNLLSIRLRQPKRGRDLRAQFTPGVSVPPDREVARYRTQGPASGGHANLRLPSVSERAGFYVVQPPSANHNRA